MFEVIVKGSSYESGKEDRYIGATYPDLVSAIAAWDLARVGTAPDGWGVFHPGEYVGAWAILIGPGLRCEQQMPGDDAVEIDDRWFAEHASE